MALLIATTTLIMLIGYLVIDDIEYEDDSIVAQLGRRLFNRSAEERKAVGRDGG